MKYYSMLTDEDIKTICYCYPYKDLITGFKKYSKDFSALWPGHRPQSVSEEAGKNLIANNPRSKLTANMVDVLLNSWVPFIKKTTKEQIDNGKDPDYAYIIAFSKIECPTFVRVFFHLSDKSYSEDHISAIGSGVEALCAVTKQIKEKNNKASATKESDALKEQYRMKLKEKDQELKKYVGDIKALSKDLEKEKETTATLREDNKRIELLQNELSASLSEIKRLRLELQDDVTRIKDAKDAYVESQEQKAELEQELTAIRAELTDCRNLLDRMEQQKQDTMKLVYGDSVEEFRPVDIEEFREYLSYNFESIGLDKSKSYFTLLLEYLCNTIFSNKPIICNQAFGRILARCLSNTLCGNSNSIIVPFTKGITASDIQALLETDARILVFDSFIGNYNEMELFPILRSAKRKIVIATAEYDKTITYLLPEEILLNCTYVNTNNIPKLFEQYELDEDPSNIKEKLIHPFYKEANRRAQRLCKEIMGELGFSSPVSNILAARMTSEEILDEYLAFSILPYSIEAYDASPYNASPRLNKYAGSIGKCKHKDLLMEWYGNV